MVLAEHRRPPTCPACAGPTPTPAPARCPECVDALAVSVCDDLDLWDAWSLLGDVGGRALSGQ